MTTATTNFGEAPRSLGSLFARPARSVRTACRDFMRSRRRARDVFHMTRILSRLNDRQLSALGLTRDRLYIDLEARYDASANFVEEVLALVDESERRQAIAHDRAA